MTIDEMAQEARDAAVRTELTEFFNYWMTSEERPFAVERCTAGLTLIEEAHTALKTLIANMKK